MPEHLNIFTTGKKNPVKFQFHEVQFTTQSMDFFENIGEPNSCKEQIYSLKLNNVYKDYFMGNQPVPNAKWLELSYISYSDYRLLSQSLQDKKQFKNYKSKF